MISAPKIYTQILSIYDIKEITNNMYNAKIS